MGCKSMHFTGILGYYTVENIYGMNLCVQYYCSSMVSSPLEVIFMEL